MITTNSHRFSERTLLVARAGLLARRPMSETSGIARGFFTIASNTPGPEASQLQTHRNYGTGGAPECKSCAPGDLAAQGYGHYPGMRRLHVHHGS